MGKLIMHFTCEEKVNKKFIRFFNRRNNAHMSAIFNYGGIKVEAK